MMKKISQQAVYYLFINVAVVTALIGIVIVIANNLASIPALVFIGVFAGLTGGLGYATFHNLKVKKVAAARIWGFWTGLAYGLAVVSGAHWLGWIDFIPDLLLLWLVGLLGLAYWTNNRVQLGLVALLNPVWLYLAFLYNQTYLPGLIILAVLFWFVFQRQAATPIFILAVVSIIWLANLYLYDGLHTAHYPLSFSTAQVWFSLALLGSLTGLSVLVIDDVFWPAYARALRWLTGAVGIVLLLVLCLSGPWNYLTANSDDRLISLIAGGVLLLLVASLVFTQTVVPAGRVTFGYWGVGYLLLAAGLMGGPMLYMYLPLAAAAIAVSVAARWLAVGLRQISWLPLMAGLVLLLVVASVSLLEWVTHYFVGAIVLLGLAGVVFVIAEKYRHSLADTQAVEAATIQREALV